MPVKILWITSGFPAHAESCRNLYLWHSIQASKKLDIELIVLNVETYKPFVKKVIDYQQFSIEIINCRYFSIPRYYLRAFSNYIYLARVVPIIKKLHQLHQFHMIHAHGEINGLSAVAASRQLQIPSIVTIHGTETCERMWSGLAGKMFRDMLNQANRIIYVGEPLQKYFKKWLTQEAHCRIVHNGFRLPSLQQLENRVFYSNRPVRLVSVSFLQEGKGVDLTLLALAKLKVKNINNWTYTIIGTGPQKKYLEDIIRKNNFEDKIIFMGDCSHQEVYAHLSASDVFCLPSYREAFGIACVEAMANGLLTIGVKNQGPQAFINHGITGFLVEPKDINSVEAILTDVINNFLISEKMQSIARAGKQYVLENFTWEKHAEKLSSIYHEVCI